MEGGLESGQVIGCVLHCMHDGFFEMLEVLREDSVASIMH